VDVHLAVVEDPGDAARADREDDGEERLRRERAALLDADLGAQLVAVERAALELLREDRARRRVGPERALLERPLAGRVLPALEPALRERDPHAARERRLRVAVRGRRALDHEALHRDVPRD